MLILFTTYLIIVSILFGFLLNDYITEKIYEKHINEWEENNE